MSRGLRALAVGTALGALTLSTTWALLFYRPLPTIDGTYRLLGLHERAEIVRDVFGIPRIYARDLHDLFFLQGYVTAQDRLAQMEEMRTVARAVFIEPAGVSEAVRGALDAYAEGVNKLVAQHAEARALPGELVLAGQRVEPWRPEDSLAIVGAYARRLAPGSRCVPLPRDLTFKGRPLLGADVYLDASAPGLYEIGLDASDARAIGVSLPGVPGILAGHNAWVAWAPAGNDATSPQARLETSLSALSARRLADLWSRDATCATDIYGERVGDDVAVVSSRLVDLDDVRAALGVPRSAVGARILIDLADVDTSRSAVSRGSSGHRSSSHYDDQAPLWEIGQTHRLPFTRGAIGRTDGELVLRAR